MPKNEPENTNGAPRLLEGYRALDLTDRKGQMCGRFLADLGVEVIKIEPPGGDPARRLPPFAGDTSLVFAHLNANKRTLELDLETAEGRERLRALAAGTDILIESGAPGWMAGMDLGYDRLSEINPGLIMASITGFGQWGPHSGFAGNDLVVFAMCGLMSISGDPDGAPCAPPETQAYYFGSLIAALGIVAALHRRERTGAGDWIDVSMQEALATQEHMVRLYANEGEVHHRAGSQHQHVAPARIFPCSDGHVYIYVSRQHWQRFLDIWPGHPEDFDAPEYLNNLYRRARADTINPAVSEFTRRHSMEDLTRLLQSNRIPCLPVNRPLGFLRDPHVEGRRFVQEVPYPDGKSLIQPALPCLFSGARPRVAAPGPAGADVETATADGDAAVGTTSGRAADAAAQGLPLEGLRVLSFDHVLAGPFGMMLLADLGAEVLKVESAKGGLDPFRFFGTGDDPNASPRFLEFNRNKRSVTVNLKHPEGPRLIRELAQHCDLVLDNFAARVMPGLGLDYDHLVEHKPDIVTLRMPGLGATGPKKGSLTLGTIITGFTGFTWLWNESPEVDPPVGAGTVLPDYVSGVMAAILSVAVTLYRRRTGRGMAMDMAQAEAAAFLIGTAMIQAANTDTEPVAVGNRSLYHAPYGIYPCEGDDRWCVIATEDDAQWRSLAAAIGRPELAGDPRFRDSADRVRRRDELDAMIGEWTRTRDRHEVMRVLQEEGVPCGAVQNGADLVENDPHLQARGFLGTHDNPRFGRLTLPCLPIRFARTAASQDWVFPDLGRDTDRTLRDVLGYDDARIRQLREDGALE
ncbi:MAG: CoA transferase [Deltaproteobacteria bacterium]|nr:CoA transferase [Deltaproteobacteria bacterium]